MNRTLFRKHAAVWLAAGVLGFVVVLRLCHWEALERLERFSYDLRARAALHFPAPAATNLAFVSIDESSIKTVANSDQLGFHATFPWPRQIYGRLVNELAQQGARAVAFDILFGEMHPNDPPVQLPDGTRLDSDQYFIQAMQARQNVLIAATPDVVPPDVFRTNCLGLGDVSTEMDPDGTLRHVRAFQTIRIWHPLFQQLTSEPELNIDLAAAVIQPGKILLSCSNSTNTLAVAVDKDNQFRLSDFGINPAPGQPTTARAFTEQRMWHMGIVLAARELHLDLNHAEVDLPNGRITLHGPGGLVRVIPVDDKGYFYLDWRIQSTDPRLSGKLIENLLLQNQQREAGQTNDLTDWAKDKLVVVGYAVEGNNLTDRGATPLENNTLLVGAHWNVANAVISNRFVRRTPLLGDLAIIVALGALTAFLTWRLRALTAFLAVVGLVAGYAGLAFFLFVEFRIWLPMLFPLVGAIFMQYAILTTIRVLFEEGEKRRVKSVFSKLVAPDVVNELLQQETLSMRGDRREVTVFFADVRGFTSLTDQMQEQVAEFVRQNGLTGAVAKECFDESAADTLLTVNRYLAKVADEVKRHQGTLDKYIGDCVMAFWNAPIPNEHHARDSVLTAIAAQRAINELNQTRLAENPAREALNAERLAAGRPPLPLHKPLQLGTGINTGSVVVGLMGSDEHVYNFTVFGREVNLASRLEGVSGSGRIIISEVTYAHLQRSDPALAARCVSLPPVMLKGFREAVNIYEVPWQS